MGFLSDKPVLKGTLPQGIVDKFPELLDKLKSSNEEELTDRFFEASRLLSLVTSNLSSDNLKGDKISRCIKFIDLTNGRFTKKDLENELSMSYETLRKNFQKKTGMSLGRYAIITRLDKAKHTMLNSGLSLSDIAEKYGYPDYFSFSKQFKQYNLISPTEYITQYKVK